MPRTAKRGLFITFEGIDGSGKTHHARRLAEWLRERGHCVTLTREPGGTRHGEEIRARVLDPNQEMTPHIEALVFVNLRREHTTDVIRPALRRGEIVISERHSDSTLAYQGYGGGLNLTHLRFSNWWATGGLRPDLTLLLDISPEEARRRKFGPTLAGADRLERADVEFHQRVADGYRALARREPGRIAVIPSQGPPDEVFAAIIQAVEPHLADYVHGGER